MALALTIDVGSTNLKAGLVNEDGEIVSLLSSANTTEFKESGLAEHDPQQLKQRILSLCKKILVPGVRNDVRCIIFSTYQFGLMLSDDRHQPLTGMTLLSDTRSQKTFSRFLKRFADDDIYRRTGCPFISQYPLARLFYFSEEERGIFTRARFLDDSKSFLFEWFTGEWKTETSTAGASQLLNVQTLDWDEEILSQIGLSKEYLPTVVDGTSCDALLRGEIRDELGLQHDVPVVLGVYDGAALAAGLSGFEPEVGIVNVGTTAMLRVPGDLPAFDQNKNVRIQAYAVRKNLFLNGGALNNAALPLNWIRKNLFEFDAQDVALGKADHELSLFSLPYLTGERDSETGPYASGVFFGLRRTNTRTDLVKSVMEGVAFSLRYIDDALRENGMSMKEIRMGGGGVNIRVWPQIFADTLGVPVIIPEGEELALIGNAMIAFSAVGVFSDLKEASGKMLKKGRTIHPQKEIVEIRDHQYRFFKKLRETVGPLFKEYVEGRY